MLKRLLYNKYIVTYRTITDNTENNLITRWKKGIGCAKSGIDMRVTHAKLDRRSAILRGLALVLVPVLVKVGLAKVVAAFLAVPA